MDEDQADTYLCVQSDNQGPAHRSRATCTLLLLEAIGAVCVRKTRLRPSKLSIAESMQSPALCDLGSGSATYAKTANSSILEVAEHVLLASGCDRADCAEKTAA
jgi:hypothetical protein